MISFQGKTAVITGAGQGIGAGTARLFARLGARVALVDVNTQAASALAKDLGGAAARDVAAYGGSVLDKSFLGRTVADVLARFGRIDILVNNAGIIRDARVEKMTEDEWDAVLDVNLKGAFLCAQAVVPCMKERRYGKIVSIISSSWLGNFGQSNYAASKGGLVSLTRTLALELARDGINVNGVSPGVVDTPMTRGLTDRVRERLLAAQPLGMMGTVDDIAHAVCFLSSDQARYITGQILHVDGGKSCGILAL